MITTTSCYGNLQPSSSIFAIDTIRKTKYTIPRGTNSISLSSGLLSRSQDRYIPLLKGHNSRAEDLPGSLLPAGGLLCSYSPREVTFCSGTVPERGMLSPLLVYIRDLIGTIDRPSSGSP